MKSILNEDLLLKRKLKISIFVVFVAFIAISTNLNATLSSQTGLLHSNNVSVYYLMLDNINFQLIEKKNIETLNFTPLISKLLQVQIPNSQKNIDAATHENKAPLTTNIFPFFMMALGYVLWKIHKRFMNKDDK